MRFQERRERESSGPASSSRTGATSRAPVGNVALRADDDDHFAVTPSATDYYAMSVADVCVVRLSEQRAGRRRAGRRPSKRVCTPVCSCWRRPECWASIHTHQPIASAYTLLARPLEVQDGRHRCAYWARRVPCVGYAPSGTSHAGRARSSRNQTATRTPTLMRNHGVVCVGKDADQAMATSCRARIRMRRLLRSARIRRNPPRSIHPCELARHGDALQSAVS